MMAVGPSLPSIDRGKMRIIYPPFMAIYAWRGNREEEMYLESEKGGEEDRAVRMICDLEAIPPKSLIHSSSLDVF